MKYVVLSMMLLLLAVGTQAVALDEGCSADADCTETGAICDTGADPKTCKLKPEASCAGELNTKCLTNAACEDEVCTCSAGFEVSGNNCVAETAQENTADQDEDDDENTQNEEEDDDDKDNGASGLVICLTTLMLATIGSFMTWV